MESIDLPAQIFRTRRFTLGVPQQFTVTPDESAVLFLRSRAGDDPVTCLWVVDLNSGIERTLADPAELPGNERADRDAGGIAGYAASQGSGLVAFTLAGGLWVVDMAGGSARRLPAAGCPADPQPDPAGQRIAYVSDGALRVIDAAGTDDQAVMEPDGPEITFGTCQHTGETSPDGLRGYWWAPNGTALLVARVDSARDTAEFEYLVGAGWDALGSYALVQSRDQQAVMFLQIDQVTGRTTVVAEPAVPIRSLVERPVLDVHATPLVLGPRELRALLYFPSWYRPGSGKLPVLADPYGGASRQLVTAELNSRSLIAQWFAEQGFAVLVADGSGTPGRGPSWEREVYGDLFGPVLDDQVTALHEAARRYPDLDLARVGIRGWSFGGSLAALAVLRRPDVFHAGVAGAGATDQRLYDAHWRERFLGHPDKFPDRYESNSLVLAAPKLTRPLLLIHGLADDNVHVAHTLRLSSALLAAGRPHEVLLLPGIGHQALGSPVTENMLWHQVRFLQRHLDASRPE